MKRDNELWGEVEALRRQFEGEVGCLRRQLAPLGNDGTVDDVPLALLYSEEQANGFRNLAMAPSDTGLPSGDLTPPSFSIFQEDLDGALLVHRVFAAWPGAGPSGDGGDVVSPASPRITGDVYCKVTLDEDGNYSREVTTDATDVEGRLTWLVKLAHVGSGGVTQYHVGAVVVGDARPDRVSLQDKHRPELGPRPVHEIFAFHDTGYVMQEGVPAAPTGDMYQVLVRDTTGPSGPVLRYLSALALGGGGGPSGPTSPLDLLVDLRYNVTGHQIEKKTVQWDFEQNFISPVSGWTVIEGGVATPLADEL